jgi:hypothetical protein
MFFAFFIFPQNPMYGAKETSFGLPDPVSFFKNHTVFFCFESMIIFIKMTVHQNFSEDAHEHYGTEKTYFALLCLSSLEFGW